MLNPDYARMAVMDLPRWMQHQVLMHLGLLQDPNGQPRAEGMRLVTGDEGASRDRFPFVAWRGKRVG